ncbi:UxaA family hydrolase [Thermoanaerobacter wiegelii]|uniref:SAF domain protein n=1 Tax=Thermoanaerobacter wiegelii Rt8.B1 TaxID=697303 RepID=G2MVJ1_9THEO|nr:UxaA family hydrolase [Thermoanaerobacter wiegelii]AEM79119.1 SAF domain protein [Thermoanaerobacter wiegelii Rt8.B1]
MVSIILSKVLESREGIKISKNNVVIINKNDNVATAIKDIKKDEILIGDVVLEVKALQSIPFGHKVALKDIQKGEKVIKYGEAIGVAFTNIHAGEHVHIHNIEGRRGRGGSKEDKDL